MVGSISGNSAGSITADDANAGAVGAQEGGTAIASSLFGDIQAPPVGTGLPSVPTSTGGPFGLGTSIFNIPSTITTPQLPPLNGQYTPPAGGSFTFGGETFNFGSFQPSLVNPSDWQREMQRQLNTLRPGETRTGFDANGNAVQMLGLPDGSVQVRNRFGKTSVIENGTDPRYLVFDSKPTLGEAFQAAGTPSYLTVDNPPRRLEIRQGIDPATGFEARLVYDPRTGSIGTFSSFTSNESLAQRYGAAPGSERTSETGLPGDVGLIRDGRVTDVGFANVYYRGRDSRGRIIVEVGTTGTGTAKRYTLPNSQNATSMRQVANIVNGLGPEAFAEGLGFTPISSSDTLFPDPANVSGQDTVRAPAGPDYGINASGGTGAFAFPDGAPSDPGVNGYLDAFAASGSGQAGTSPLFDPEQVRLQPGRSNPNDNSTGSAVEDAATGAVASWLYRPFQLAVGSALQVGEAMFGSRLTEVLGISSDDYFAIIANAAQNPPDTVAGQLGGAVANTAITLPLAAAVPTALGALPAGARPAAQATLAVIDGIDKVSYLPRIMAGDTTVAVDLLAELLSGGLTTNGGRIPDVADIPNVTLPTAGPRFDGSFVPLRPTELSAPSASIRDGYSGTLAEQLFGPLTDTPKFDFSVYRDNYPQLTDAQFNEMTSVFNGIDLTPDTPLYRGVPRAAVNVDQGGNVVVTPTEAPIGNIYDFYNPNPDGSTLPQTVLPGFIQNPRYAVRPASEFGPGYYLTTDRTQAAEYVGNDGVIVQTTLGEMLARGIPLGPDLTTGGRGSAIGGSLGLDGVEVSRPSDAAFFAPVSQDSARLNANGSLPFQVVDGPGASDIRVTAQANRDAYIQDLIQQTRGIEVPMPQLANYGDVGITSGSAPSDLAFTGGTDLSRITFNTPTQSSTVFLDPDTSDLRISGLNDTPGEIVLANPNRQPIVGFQDMPDAGRMVGEPTTLRFIPDSSQFSGSRLLENGVEISIAETSVPVNVAGGAFNPQRNFMPTTDNFVVDGEMRSRPGNVAEEGFIEIAAKFPDLTGTAQPGSSGGVRIMVTFLKDHPNDKMPAVLTEFLTRELGSPDIRGIVGASPTDVLDYLALSAKAAGIDTSNLGFYVSAIAPSPTLKVGLPNPLNPLGTVLDRSGLSAGSSKIGLTDIISAELYGSGKQRLRFKLDDSINEGGIYVDAEGNRRLNVVQETLPDGSTVNVLAGRVHIRAGVDQEVGASLSFGPFSGGVKSRETLGGLKITLEPGDIIPDAWVDYFVQAANGPRALLTETAAMLPGSNFTQFSSELQTVVTSDDLANLGANPISAVARGWRAADIPEWGEVSVSNLAVRGLFPNPNVADLLGGTASKGDLRWTPTSGTEYGTLSGNRGYNAYWSSRNTAWVRYAGPRVDIPFLEELPYAPRLSLGDATLSGGWRFVRDPQPKFDELDPAFTDTVPVNRFVAQSDDYNFANLTYSGRLDAGIYTPPDLTQTTPSDVTQTDSYQSRRAIVSIATENGGTATVELPASVARALAGENMHGGDLASIIGYIKPKAGDFGTLSAPDDASGPRLGRNFLNYEVSALNAGLVPGQPLPEVLRTYLSRVVKQRNGLGEFANGDTRAQFTPRMDLSDYVMLNQALEARGKPGTYVPTQEQIDRDYRRIGDQSSSSIDPAAFAAINGTEFETMPRTDGPSDGAPRLTEPVQVASAELSGLRAGPSTPTSSTDTPPYQPQIPNPDRPATLEDIAARDAETGYQPQIPNPNRPATLEDIQRLDAETGYTTTAPGGPLGEEALRARFPEIFNRPSQLTGTAAGTFQYVYDAALAAGATEAEATDAAMTAYRQALGIDRTTTGATATDAAAQTPPSTPSSAGTNRPLTVDEANALARAQIEQVLAASGATLPNLEDIVAGVVSDLQNTRGNRIDARSTQAGVNAYNETLAQTGDARQAETAAIQAIVGAESSRRYQAAFDQTTDTIFAYFDTIGNGLANAIAAENPELAGAIRRGVAGADVVLNLLDLINGADDGVADLATSTLRLLQTGVAGPEISQAAGVVLGGYNLVNALGRLGGQNWEQASFDAIGGAAAIFSTGIFGNEAARIATDIAAYANLGSKAAQYFTKPTTAGGLQLASLAVGLLWKDDVGQFVSNSLGLGASIAGAQAAGALLGPVGIAFAAISFVKSLDTLLNGKTLKISDTLDASGDGVADKITFKTKRDDWFYEVTNGTQTLPISSLGYRITQEQTYVGYGRVGAAEADTEARDVTYLDANGNVQTVSMTLRMSPQRGGDGKTYAYPTGGTGRGGPGQGYPTFTDANGQLWAQLPRGTSSYNPGGAAVGTQISYSVLEAQAFFDRINDSPSLGLGTASTRVVITPEQLAAFDASLGGVRNGVLIGGDARVEQFRPMFGARSVTYQQEKKNEGMTYYDDVNGDGVQDRVIRYTKIERQTDGDDSVRYQILDRAGRVYMEYATDKAGNLSTNSRAARDIPGASVFTYDGRQYFGRINGETFVDYLTGRDTTLTRTDRGGLGGAIRGVDRGTALYPGQSLRANEMLTSADGGVGLILQGDGNLTLWELRPETGEPLKLLWASNTAGQGGNRLALGTDGNLALFAGDRAIWTAGTAGRGAAFRVEPNGYAVVYDAGGAAAWSVGEATRDAQELAQLARAGFGGSESAAAAQARTASSITAGAAEQAMRGISGDNQWSLGGFRDIASISGATPIPDGITIVGAGTDTGLGPNEALMSANGRYLTVMQTDNNLVTYDLQDGGRVVYNTGSGGRGPGGRLEIHVNGHLVVYDAANQPIVTSNTWNNDAWRNYDLTLGDNGILALYERSTGKLLWTDRNGTLAQATAGVETIERAPRQAVASRDINAARPETWGTTQALAYLAANPDLLYAYGADPAAAQAHAAEYGRREGRPMFDIPAYLSARPDLVAYYGTQLGLTGADYETAVVNHYLTYGRFEAAGLTPPSLWNDTQAAAYLDAHPDLVTAYGYDLAAARYHFERYGFIEGRAVSAGQAAASAPAGTVDDTQPRTADTIPWLGAGERIIRLNDDNTGVTYDRDLNRQDVVIYVENDNDPRYVTVYPNGDASQRYRAILATGPDGQPYLTAPIDTMTFSVIDRPLDQIMGVQPRPANDDQPAATFQVPPVGIA